MVGPGGCRHLNVDHWVGQSQEMAHLALGPQGCTLYGSRVGGLLQICTTLGYHSPPDLF